MVSEGFMGCSKRLTEKFNLDKSEVQPSLPRSLISSLQVLFQSANRKSRTAGYAVQPAESADAGCCAGIHSGNVNVSRRSPSLGALCPRAIFA
jgi:hypothetical protein